MKRKILLVSRIISGVFSYVQGSKFYFKGYSKQFQPHVITVALSKQSMCAIQTDSYSVGLYLYNEPEGGLGEADVEH